MGPLAREHHDVVAVALQSVVVPLRVLPPLVLGVHRQGGLGVERLLRGVGVEDELQHLPVAFVLVVPVVVDPPQPVLEHQLAGVVGIAGHAGVDGGAEVAGHPVPPRLVVTARVERVAGQVEVVVVAEPEQVGGGRCPLHHLPVGSHERHVRTAEHRLHGGGHERLTLAAVLGLAPHGDDRGVLLGQLRRGIGAVLGPCGPGDPDGQPRHHHQAARLLRRGASMPGGGCSGRDSSEQPPRQWGRPATASLAGATSPGRTGELARSRDRRSSPGLNRAREENRTPTCCLQDSCSAN